MAGIGGGCGGVSACVTRWFSLVQSSLFGEGGNIYNMQAGGPRPGMHGNQCDDSGCQFVSGFRGCCGLFVWGYDGSELLNCVEQEVFSSQEPIPHLA